MKSGKLFLCIIFSLIGFHLAWATPEIEISIDKSSGCSGSKVIITLSPNGEVPSGTVYKYFYNSGTSTNIRNNVTDLIIDNSPTVSGYFYAIAYKDGNAIDTSENAHYTVINVPTPTVEVPPGNACFSWNVPKTVTGKITNFNSSFQYTMNITGDHLKGGTFNIDASGNFTYTVSSPYENTLKFKIEAKMGGQCLNASSEQSVIFKLGADGLKENVTTYTIYMSSPNTINLKDLFGNIPSGTTIKFSRVVNNNNYNYIKNESVFDPEGLPEGDYTDSIKFVISNSCGISNGVLKSIITIINDKESLPSF